MRSQFRFGLCVIAVALGTTSCAKQESKTPASSEATPERPIPPPGTGPDAKTPLARPEPQPSPEVQNAILEPQGPVDSKNAEAAEAVVKQYAALIQQHRFDEAKGLWTKPQGDFLTPSLSRDPPARIVVHPPDEQQGAAGSVYIKVSVAMYDADGGLCAGWFTLRRVNDIPGSTVEQRRWHIVNYVC